MATSGKKKTTMAKMNREHKVRERRMEKKAKKDARKLAAANPPDATSETYVGDDGLTIETAPVREAE
jgi:hypothetical protein